MGGGQDLIPGVLLSLEAHSPTRGGRSDGVRGRAGWMGQPGVNTPRMLKGDRLPQVSAGLEAGQGSSPKSWTRRGGGSSGSGS